MIIAGVAKDLRAAVHAQSGSAQVATGTMYCVVQLESTDADDGKYWDTNAGGSWQASPVAWPEGAHTQAGVWSYELPASATTGKAGATISYTYTDNLTEASATTVCGGGEHRINAEDPLATTDVLSVNVTQISGGSVAADNLEATYDGTGYSDDNAPAKQSQVANIAITGAAVNVVASSFVQTTGTVTGGTISDTDQLNAVFHTLADAAGTQDAYYEFDVGADGVPTQVGWNGYLQSSNDTVRVFAYNWSGASWDQIGAIAGANPTSVVSQTWTLLTRHGGSSANAGKVRIRFQSTGLTSSVLATDRLYVSYSVVRRSVGYALGAIWIDTLHGTDGATPYIHGTADLPCLTWANALSLSTALGLRNFRIANGSSVVLTSDTSHFTLSGEEWNLDLNGQACEDAVFVGAHVCCDTSDGFETVFVNCDLGTPHPLIVGGLEAHACALVGDIVLSSDGTYFLDQCYSGVAGTAMPTITFAQTSGNALLNMRHYSGGIEILGMGVVGGDDRMSIEGNGQLVIDSSCMGGTIAIGGNFTVTDNSGGVVTLSQNARLDVQQVRDAMKLAPAAGSPPADSVDKHLDDIITAIAAVSPATGSEMVTLTAQTSGLVAVPDVSVGIYDSANTALISTHVTDSNGQVVTALNDGTYKVRLRKAGYTFTVPETLTVSGATSDSFTATAWAPSVPSAVDLCVVFGTLVDAGGDPLTGAIIEARVAVPDAVGGYRLANPKETATTDGDGYFELELVRGAHISLICTPAGIRGTFLVPASASQDFATWEAL